MAYKITFWHRKRPVYAKAWPCDLEAATKYAKAQLPIQHTQHRASSVSVTCERTGEVVFSLAEQPELTNA
jgi:hypothetical protein